MFWAYKLMSADATISKICICSIRALKYANDSFADCFSMQFAPDRIVGHGLSLHRTDTETIFTQISFRFGMNLINVSTIQRVCSCIIIHFRMCELVQQIFAVHSSHRLGMCEIICWLLVVIWCINAMFTWQRNEYMCKIVGICCACAPLQNWTRNCPISHY